LAGVFVSEPDCMATASRACFLRAFSKSSISALSGPLSRSAARHRAPSHRWRKPKSSPRYRAGCAWARRIRSWRPLREP